MEEMEKGRPKSIGRWLQKKALDLWPPLVEKVLRSDTLQGVLLDQLEKRIIRELWVLADPSKPQRVHKDQEDMVWAFMQSFRRALERHQLSRETFQGLLRSLLLLAIMRQPFLSWKFLERIISEAKSLWGLRFFTISGGEPLLYRAVGKGILDLGAKHGDCFFLDVYQWYSN